jgi:hypothetical protein
VRRVHRYAQTKKRRLKYAAGSAAKQTAVANGVQKEIERQREFEIDAAMVRIMKSRNVLSWNELTSETIRALKVTHSFGAVVAPVQRVFFPGTLPARPAHA